MSRLDKETEVAAPRVFATTHWSVVLAAGEGDSPPARRALEALCAAYWYPIYIYVRRKGHGPDDAQDLTQEFFAQLIAKEHLRLADRTKGKFRTFLLAMLDQFLANERSRAQRQKRGGQFQFVSLDQQSVETTTGTLYIKTGGSIQVLPETVSDVSTINGNLDFNPGAHVLNIGAGIRGPGEPDLLIPALVTGVLGSVDLQKNGPGTLRLTANNTYSGSTVVVAGILQVDGSQAGSSVTVHGGAQLMGTGRVGAVNFANANGVPGVVAPGHSPGVLSCGNFNLGTVGGSLRIELNGTTPGPNGYDQLWVRGALSFVELGGVTLDASLNFASTVNDQFIILRKDGVRLVTGEFTGLPEGANFYVGGEQFTITYAGGDGNDVVLTRVPTPPRPALTIERVAPSFVRVLWPASFDGYTLQSTTNLSPPNWTATVPLPVATGTNNVVTNATSPGSRFYRLFKP